MASTQPLVCALFGVRGFFVAEISFKKRGADLKSMLKSEMPTRILCKDRQLRVFPALENGQWLESDSDLAAGLRAGMRDDMFCREDLELTDQTRIDTWLQSLGMTGERAPQQNQVHLVVVQPTVSDFNRQVAMEYLTNRRSTATKRNKQFKKRVMRLYGSVEEDQMLHCMLLDVALPSTFVTAAHLFEHSKGPKAPSLLSFDCIDDPKNGLLLFKPLEIAFDHHEIGFILNKNNGQFELKIFDPALRTQRLFDVLNHSLQTQLLNGQKLPRRWRRRNAPVFLADTGFDLQTTFGHIENKPLCFKSEARPYKRCLNLQARLARVIAVDSGWDCADFDDFLVGRLPDTGRAAPFLATRNDG